MLLVGAVWNIIGLLMFSFSGPFRFLSMRQNKLAFPDDLVLVFLLSFIFLYFGVVR